MSESAVIVITRRTSLVTSSLRRKSELIPFYVFPPDSVAQRLTLLCSSDKAAGCGDWSWTTHGPPVACQLDVNVHGVQSVARHRPSDTNRATLVDFHILSLCSWSRGRIFRSRRGVAGGPGRWKLRRQTGRPPGVTESTRRRHGHRPYGRRSAPPALPQRLHRSQLTP